MLLALACMLGGTLAHVRGVRDVDGSLIAVGVLTASAGLGTALNLVGGRTELTVGVATLTMVSVIIGASAAFMAFLDALERHDVGIDAQRLVRSLELARLTARDHRHAELAHDQRTALLAIEAAALQLRDQPSNGLADAVATEAARLQRMLDGASTDRGLFPLNDVVTPVMTCLSTLHSPIRVDVDVDVDGQPHVWGHIDETAEILRALVVNAHEHGRAPVSVEITDFGADVVVHVRDSGEGVPPALRSVIFDRGVTSDPAGHSGLGLFAARRLARTNGGDLTISDDDAATFELRLPTRPADTTVIDLTDTAQQRPDLRSLHG
jgi:signal transduction histidine kinase